MQLSSVEISPGRTIALLAGDLTTVSCDAMVNAANSELAGGGGVDGAIHRAGGPEIMEELTRRYRGCETGSAVLTRAGRLPCSYVIHAVGPVWRGGGHGEESLLGSAYATAFSIASEYGCAKVASCAISTGVYRYPVREAAVVAVRAASQALDWPASVIREIIFVLRGDDHVLAFVNALRTVSAERGAGSAG